MKKPKAKECRCWVKYPNPMRKERCAYYECVEKGNRLTRKTVCRLKSQTDTDEREIQNVLRYKEMVKE